MKEIPLTRGLVATVDDEDYEMLSAYKWYAHNHHIRFYAARSECNSSGRRLIYMHRQLIFASGTDVVDHINGNALDNRRENLRVGNQRQNLQHMMRIKSDLPHGVTKLKGRNKYRVRPFFNGTYYYLGSYHTAKDAETVYRVACVVMTGHDIYPYCDLKEKVTG